jgi:ribosomal protein S18 acetylase RimI-like enzyme
MSSPLPAIPTYKIIRIPPDSLRLASFIAKLRATKMAAMKADPKGFFAKHETETALPASVWEARFKICAAVLICVATSDTSLSDEDTLEQGDWVGYAAIRGPMDYAAYYPNPDMDQPVPEDPSTEARWHVFDLYTLLAHRQRGLARKLLDSCVDISVEFSKELRSQGMQRARLRLFVDGRNPWLVQWYKMLGFMEAGRASPIEGFTANGVSESIPVGAAMTDEVKKFWESRIGLSLDRVIQLA